MGGRSRIVLVCAVAAALTAFFLFDADRYLTLGYLREQHAALAAHVEANALSAAAIYFIVYVAVTALSLPGATVLTLVGGALFGLLWGIVIVSFASTLGATLAFLLSRYLFRDVVARRFRNRLDAVDKGVERDGAFYLFTLRLVPLFPFFVINLLMGLTSIRVATYAVVSQIGMLPATVVYVNAGGQLADVAAPGDILSPGLLASFAALGLFPLLARISVRRLKARRTLKKFPRPRTFDRNVIVIGAGSAGLVASYLAAALRARVTLIEKHAMGGDCLNTGCVPSKALLHSARVATLVREAHRSGIRAGIPDVDFAAVMARVRTVIERIAPHDSVARYSALGVDCIDGEARLISPYRVAIGNRELSARNIVVATGATPFVPPIPGLADVPYLTSDTLWDLDRLPPRLLVLGGGPIGCELSQAFARLGSCVTQVEMAPRLLLREDEAVSAAIQDALVADGVRCEVNRRAVAFAPASKGFVCRCESTTDPGAAPVEFAFDEVIVAVGRRAATAGLGLEDLGIEFNDDATIATDDYLATSVPNIFACGDCAGPYQFTHVGAHQAWYATVNSLFGGLRRFAVDYSVIPWCTFTAPEVARVGLNESEARDAGIAYELTTYDLDDLDRAITDGVDAGTVRVLTVPGRDRILGVTIVGEHAGDLIAEFVLAMKHGLGLNKILQTIHIYPTLAEANKYAAGAWRREHTPERIMRLLSAYHRWRRGGD